MCNTSGPFSVPRVYDRDPTKLAAASAVDAALKGQSVSAFKPRSIVRTATKVYLAPLIVIGGLAAIVFILGVLAMSVQLGAIWLRHLTH